MILDFDANILELWVLHHNVTRSLTDLKLIEPCGMHVSA